ncbi:MAG: InlB B-repeat-containing protein, partial [Bacteroidota bacterium]
EVDGAQYTTPVTVEEGTALSLEAIAEEGWEFVNWTGDTGYVDDPDATSTTVTIPSDNVILSANFLLSTYAVTFIIENEHGETISDAVVTLDQAENPQGDYVFDEVLPGDYSYTVTAETYFDASGDVEVIDQDVTETVVMEVDDTGIAETQTPEITIFPNPVRSTLYVESNMIISQIQLLDMLGQCVLIQAVNDIHHELNVSGLPDGLYFIQALSDSGVKTLRVQIIK